MNQTLEVQQPGLVAATTRGAEVLPDALALEGVAPGSRADVELQAPATTLERLYVLALALRALKPGGVLRVSAARNRGGLRLRKELEAFGCKVEEQSGQHARTCTAVRPREIIGFDEAIAAGAMRYDDALGLWTQPGLFAWDRLDSGTQLLLQHLPPLAGQGADFGCGLGILSREVLQSPAVTGLYLIDNDRRAIEAARRNVVDQRARFIHGDITNLRLDRPLDFVVANPPFHTQGHESRALGIAFVAAAARGLGKGGLFCCVANRHLPYEAALQANFATVNASHSEGGFKIMSALR